ncbi:TPA: hypothetical protein BOS_12505 [Bos taurus]|nr:TPA: hypothetical protein BOS_12505 [Bos taurus]
MPGLLLQREGSARSSLKRKEENSAAGLGRDCQSRPAQERGRDRPRSRWYRAHPQGSAEPRARPWPPQVLRRVRPWVCYGRTWHHTGAHWLGPGPGCSGGSRGKPGFSWPLLLEHRMAPASPNIKYSSKPEGKEGTLCLFLL